MRLSVIFLTWLAVTFGVDPGPGDHHHAQPGHLLLHQREVDRLAAPRAQQRLETVRVVVEHLSREDEADLLLGVLDTFLPALEDELVT